MHENPAAIRGANARKGKKKHADRWFACLCEIADKYQTLKS